MQRMTVSLKVARVKVVIRDTEKREIKNKEDKINDLLHNIKDTKSMNKTEKLIEFNCSECHLTFNLKRVRVMLK